VPWAEGTSDAKRRPIMKTTTPTKSEKASLVNAGSGFYAVYLYYFTKDGKFRIYEWWDPEDDIDDQNDAKFRIMTLIGNAYYDKTDPDFYTDNYNFMIMRRKSYLVFAASVEYWKTSFNTIEASGKNQVGSDIDGYHTFYSSRPLADPSGKHLIFYCENHMMSSIPDASSPNGAKLRNKEFETFTFKMLFAPRAEAVILTDPDPGGTNMGPPVPPPSGELYPPLRSTSA
jgi:hypothetical protein